MSVSQLGLHLWAANAGANLTGKLFYLGRFDSSGNIVVASGAGQSVLGPIIEEATQGNPATVQMSGIGKVVLGASVLVGARLTTDSTGKAVTSSSGNFEIGTALAPGDSGDIIPFMMSSGRT